MQKLVLCHSLILGLATGASPRLERHKPGASALRLMRSTPIFSCDKALGPTQHCDEPSNPFFCRSHVATSVVADAHASLGETRLRGACFSTFPRKELS